VAENVGKTLRIMRCNDAGINIIKTFEGFEKRPYKCSAGVTTIGFGTTRINGRPVTMDMEPINYEEAEELLRLDLEQSEKTVSKLMRVQLDSNEFSALCSLCYNIGSGNLQSSTLRSKLNRDDRIGAADEFPKWRRAGGRILAGLVRRRAIERELFLS